MTSTTAQEFHIEITDTETTTIDWLTPVVKMSKQKIKQIMSKGAVWHTHDNHTQRVRRAKKKLKIGDELHLYYDEQVLAQTPTPAKLIADEGSYSIWYKPYGMLSQGSKWGDHCTIQRWAEQHIEPQRTAFVIHRLDRAATGLMIIAHSKQAARAFSACFKERSIEKHYQVIVHGEYSLPAQPESITETIDEKEAITHIQPLKFNPYKNQTLLDVQIETGRKHQIRKHLAGIGFPVVGDRLYGEGDTSMDLQLTACSLTFTCPFTHWKKSYVLPDDRALSF